MVISLRKASGKWINPNGICGQDGRHEDVVSALEPGLHHTGPGGFLPEINQDEVDQQQPKLVPEELAGFD
jgi:hypothetical protein